MIAFLDSSALIELLDRGAARAQATKFALEQLASEAPNRQLAVSRLSFLECRVAPSGGAIKPAFPVEHRLR